MQTQNLTVLSTSTLSGNNVRNAEGEDLGSIKDFMIDLDSGYIAYAVLSFGGFLGFGDKLFAIPFEALRVDTDDECFVLDVNKDALDDAPGFDKNDWPSAPERAFITRVYTHYGYDPFYDEAGRVRTREPQTLTAEGMTA